jgi:L-threonylcarbamoyladenylate synthase
MAISMSPAEPRWTEIPPPDAGAIARAAALLRAGRLVGMPTETVYGLAGDARNPASVAAIFAAKGRPAFNPLIAHVPGVAEALREAVLDADALALAEAFWPGPLTIVAPLAPGASVCELARAGLASVAVRAPSHPVARALMAAFGAPLAAPSANRSGHVSATDARHVADDLGGAVDLILDAGPSKIGVESTIVACLGGAPRLLRHGAITREDIERVLRRPVEASAPAGAPLAPGALASHYAPRAMLRLDAREAEDGEAVLDFAGQLLPSLRAEGEAIQGPAHGALWIASASPRKDGPYRDLSASGDLTEAAANLFAYLRELDSSGAARIAAAPIPVRGLGAAINDRLRRAAAPRGA